MIADRYICLLIASLCLCCGGNSSAEDEKPDDTEPVCTTGVPERPAAPCPDGWFEYTDMGCSQSGQCTELGDGLCYRRCETSADCSDPCAPDCGFLQLCNYAEQCVGRADVCL